MQGPLRERMKKLCELIVAEQDPARFLRLVQELNDLLQQNRERINDLGSGSSPHQSVEN